MEQPPEHSDDEASEVIKRYRGASTEEPSAQLDAAVLRAAREELASAASTHAPQSWWQNWSRPLASVAVMGICLAVVLSVLDSAPRLIELPKPADSSLERSGRQLVQDMEAPGPSGMSALANRSLQKETVAAIAPSDVGEPPPELPARMAPPAVSGVAPANEVLGLSASKSGLADAADGFAPVPPLRAQQRVLVLGGTGRLGAAICAELRAAGYPVTVLARASSDRSRLRNLEVEYLIGDLLDADSVQRALEDQSFTYVIDASGRGRNPEPFYVQVMEHTLAALKGDSVEQFILHGSIGAGDSASVFSAATYARMRGVMAEKTEAEALLKASGLPYTIIRNGSLKPGGTPATGTAELTPNTQKMGTVTRRDLAVLTLECLGNPACGNTTLHAIDPGWGDTPD